MKVAEYILSFVWQIIKSYFLEITILLFSILLAFSDIDFFKNEGKIYTIIAAGILAIASFFSKVKEGYKSNEFHKSFDDLKDSIEKKDEKINESHNLIKQFQEETQEKSSQLEEQNDLITRLIKGGLISEKSIYEIIQKNKFFYLFCYQNVPDQENLQKKIFKKDFRNPSLEAVEEMGFVKVGTRSNLYAIPANMLHSSLRSEEKIESLLQKLVKEKWEKFLLEFENSNESVYRKYIGEHGDPTNCTYMIMSSNFHDVVINYVGYNSFSKEFKNILKYNVDIKKLKKEVSKRKHDIKEFIKSISYELLFSEIEIKKDRDLIQQNADDISKKLKTNNIFELKDKKSELKTELLKLFKALKASKYANIISNKSQKYYDLFILLGIEV